MSSSAFSGEGRTGVHAEHLRAIAIAFDQIRRQVGRQPVATVMESVVRVAVDRLPAADWASITLLHNKRFQTVAASDERAQLADNIQYQLRSGPCVDAILSDAVVLVEDVREDRRWPQFSQRAAGEYGVGSILSHRLTFDDDDDVGGLNLYSERPRAFGDEARDVALLLAASSGLAVAASRNRELADQMKRGLESNRDIGIAIGVLMGTAKLTREDAFHLLRGASQHTHRKLRDVAVEVADTGVLPLPPPRGSD